MIYRLIFVCCVIFADFVHSTEKVQVVTELFPPYQVINENKGVDGWSTELVKAILAEAKVNYKIDIFPWPRAYRKATNNSSTLIYSLLRNKQRENQFLWIAPLCNIEVSFYKNKYRQDIEVDSLEDARNYVVGIGRDQAEFEFLTDNGFILDKNLIVASNYSQSRKMIERNRIDLIIASDNFVDILRSETIRSSNELELVYAIKELQQELYLAANINTPLSLVSELRGAYERIKHRFVNRCGGRQGEAQ
ncbi:substrate-binding periplasmic protein [Aliikangiella coralliicola]|uniref:Transporter substrate-binding domain-containing protein n=1 Tax=Aliikangiella coralliicola TaxID=2592383 RepID=A0A545U7X7_9GAMM|nr:transporter substrate-binding domain-containing protein [Aliikangiella coralliicola]TQV85575.1 transporter substrate-binding domain-containing protein [Aliikangiella coralliicola]